MSLFPTSPFCVCMCVCFCEVTEQEICTNLHLIQLLQSLWLRHRLMYTGEHYIFFVCFTYCMFGLVNFLKLYFSGGFLILVWFRLLKTSSVVFWVSTVCCLTDCYQPFRGSSCHGSPASCVH